MAHDVFYALNDDVKSHIDTTIDKVYMTEFKTDDELQKMLFGIVKVMKMSIFKIKHYSVENN